MLHRDRNGAFFLDGLPEFCEAQLYRRDSSFLLDKKCGTSCPWCAIEVEVMDDFSMLPKSRWYVAEM